MASLFSLVHLLCVRICGCGLCDIITVMWFHDCFVHIVCCYHSDSVPLICIYCNWACILQHWDNHTVCNSASSYIYCNNMQLLMVTSQVSRLLHSTCMHEQIFKTYEKICLHDTRWTTSLNTEVLTSSMLHL